MTRHLFTSILIVTSLLLTSCTFVKENRHVVGGSILAASALAVGVGVWKSKESRKAVSVTPLDLPDQPTGSMITLGGMLVDDDKVVFVDHWPVKIDQKVRFRGLDGKLYTRTIAEKQTIAGSAYGSADLCVLFLNEPLLENNHKMIPIREGVEDKDVTIYRIDRPKFGTNIRSNLGNRYKARCDEGEIKSGDSGKIWVQKIDGEISLVSLTSKGWWGEGPNLWEYRDEIVYSERTKVDVE